MTAGEVGKMPSRRSVAEGPFLAAKVPYSRRVFVEALSYGRMPPNIPHWNEVLDSMQRGLDSIWQGKATVSAGTAKADGEINKILDKWHAEEKTEGSKSK